MNLFENIKIEELWEDFIIKLSNVDREGVKDLLAFLEDKTDIQVAPASSKFHSNFPGGLMYHSLKVLHFLKIVNKSLNLNISEDSMTIVALGHDFCKLNYYKIGKVWDKEYKQKYNKWREIDQYIIENQLPLGHGEKSLLMVNKFISMFPEEMTAIRWHMGAWEQSLHFYNDQSQSYREATDKYPLVKALQIADQMAELHESVYPGGEDA